MNRLKNRVLSVVPALALAAGVLAASPAQADDPVVLNLLGINDFHGRIDANTVKLAGTIEQLRSSGGEDATLLVSAGDNVSASLFASSVQGDIPTIDVLNALELDASAAGNHEFDKGYDDLVDRLAPAADFPFLGANVRKADDTPALDASAMFEVEGLKVAVIGAVTEETPALVTPDGIAGLTFGDPVAAINATVDDLEALPEPPDVIVASYHEGAPDGSASLEDALASSAVFSRLVEQTDGAVDAIFMGHTHQVYAYDAPRPGGGTRPVIQTGSYGANVGQVRLSVDPATGDVLSHTQSNVARTSTADSSLVSTFPRVAEVKEITDAAIANANEIGKQPVGEQTADITTAYAGGARDDRAAESTLGNLVADAMLSQVAKTPAGADLALGNPGGLRAELPFAGKGGTDADGVITFEEVLSVLTFTNNLSTVTLTGASLEKVFEQQWQRDAKGAVPSRAYLQLGTSSNVRYSFDPDRDEGDRITSLFVDDEPVSPARSYRIAVPSFLTSGGDNFHAFRDGTAVDSGLVDYQAFIDFLEESSPVSPDYRRHSVQVMGLQDVYAAGGTLSFSLPKLDLTSLGVQKNSSVSARLVWEGGSRSLGTKAVTDGASAPFEGTLPDGVTGPMSVTIKANPTGTTAEVPILVKKAATVTGEAGPAAFGEDVEVEVEVATEGATPTGDVTLLDGDTELGEATLAGGAATFTVDTADLGAGTSTLDVRSAGDGAVAPGTGTVQVQVAKAATTTTADAPGRTRKGEALEVGVEVDSATGTDPAGTVEVRSDDTVVGTASVGDDGAATVPVDVDALALGDTALDVVYVGDADHETSSTSVEVEVVKGSSALAATSDPQTYGRAGRVSVTGADGASGLVYVAEGDVVVGIGTMSDGAGSVVLDATAMRPGEHALRVFYGGSESYDPTDVVLDHTVVKAPVSVRGTVTNKKVVVKRTKARAKITVRATGFTVTDGTVQLKSGWKVLATGTVKDGVASVTLPTFAATGTRNLSIVYSGGDLTVPGTGTLPVRIVRK